MNVISLNESNNMKKFYEYYKDNDNNNYKLNECSKNIIIMDYYEGEKYII